MATVRVFAYENETPGNDEICRVFQLSDYAKFTYIVSTKAQSNARKDLLIKNKSKTSHQFEEDKPNVVFHEFLRHSINKKFLSRTEERTLLVQAIKEMEILKDEPEIYNLLGNDVITWRDVFADMAQRGLDFSGEIPSECQEKLVSPRVGDIIQSLQSQYKILKQEKNLTSLEEEAYTYLKCAYEPTECVVMEGFTFLTPLQQEFIKRVNQFSDNTELKLLVPFRQAQELGFEVIQRTYYKKDIASIIKNQKPIIIDKKNSQSLDKLAEEKQTKLVFLQRNLFSFDEVYRQLPTVSFDHLDNSVYLEAYSHRNQEIVKCIEKIEAYIKNDRIPPKEIVIVTRNRGDFHTILQEEIEHHDIRDFDGSKISLGFQPRQLLLTPLGKFVLTLYQIWEDDCLHMDDEQFESILASGWLGTSSQKTVESFNSVKAQIFTNCKLKDEWVDKLQNLSDLRDKLPQDSRSAVKSIEDKYIELWLKIISKLDNICKKLFSFGEKTIGEHIKKLSDELNYLEPESMFKAEKEVLDRIKVVFEELENSSSSLKIFPEEFGVMINSLSQERHLPDDEEEPDTNNKIWLTTPEGIDGRQKDVVFYLGIDSDKVPRHYPEPFPFYKNDIDEHQEKERYFFLSVVRSAKKYLHLTYSKKEQDQSFSPSLYLNQSSELIKSPISEKTKFSGEQLEEIEPTFDQQNRKAFRSEYTLSEIAHFALCPMRYKLERLNSKATQYKDKFQLAFLAQGEWMRLIMDYLIESKKIMKTKDAVLTEFNEAMQQTEKQIKTMFPGFRLLDWNTIKSKIEQEIQYIASEIFKSPYSLGLQSTYGVDLKYVLLKEERQIKISAKINFSFLKGKYLYPYLNDIMRYEWLIPSDKQEQVDEVIITENQCYFSNLRSAVKWWRKSIETIFFLHSSDSTSDFREQQKLSYDKKLDEIGIIIKNIETSKYPKRSGDHCRYCPSQSECLGLEEEI